MHIRLGVDFDRKRESCAKVWFNRSISWYLSCNRVFGIACIKSRDVTQLLLRVTEGHWSACLERVECPSKTLIRPAVTVHGDLSWLQSTEGTRQPCQTQHVASGGNKSQTPRCTHEVGAIWLMQGKYAVRKAFGSRFPAGMNKSFVLFDERYAGRRPPPKVFVLCAKELHQLLLLSCGTS